MTGRRAQLESQHGSLGVFYRGSGKGWAAKIPSKKRPAEVMSADQPTAKKRARWRAKTQ